MFGRYISLVLISFIHTLSFAYTKVVIPAAGYGTRFMPATKIIPKELLPIVHTPAITLILQECLFADCADCYLIVNEDKQAIKDYLKSNEKLEDKLKRSGKAKLLKDHNSLLSQISVSYIDQPEMKGTGHAVLMARPFINKDEYFGVIFPDMLLATASAGICEALRIAKKYKATVIGVQKVASQEVSAYGIIKIRMCLEKNIFELEDIVEKPRVEDAPSLYANMGRFVFSYDIFDAIDHIQPAVNGEIQLTDAITYLIKSGHRVLAYDVESLLFDIGTPPGWIAANLYFGLHSEYGATIAKSIVPLIQELR